MIIKVTALCVSMAMICSALRLSRPEMATALSLGTGMVVVMLLAPEMNRASGWTRQLEALFSEDADIMTTVLKGTGIAITAELGGQLCVDAGESALAGRISLASRVAMLGLCAPMLIELTRLMGEVLA